MHLITLLSVPMSNTFRWFDNHKDLGVLFLRIFVGLRLIYGVIDNIFSWEKMIEFSQFLKNFGFPLPLFSAALSVDCQLIAGMMILIGFRIRLAPIVMIINFIVALVMVHSNDTIEGMTPALAMLFCSVLFLFQGSGKYSIK
jgi:putative oxidoreductase